MNQAQINQLVRAEIGRFFPIPSEGNSVPNFDSDAQALRVFPLDLSTARDKVEIKIGGNFLWCANASLASADFSIAFSREQGSDSLPFKSGTAIKGINFRSIYVTNSAQAGVTAYLVYIVEGGQNLEIVNPGLTITTVATTKATSAAAPADVVCNNGATTVVLAASSTRRLARFTNTHAANSVRIGPSATVGAAAGTPLAAGETVEMYATVAYSVRNDSGAAVNIAVYTESD